MPVVRKRLVVLTGAGISAESGIQTFRDADGLWEQHRIEDVATPEGWAKNPQLVLDFYNARLQKLREVNPNPGHTALADLERTWDVRIITQNVDDLHERAGSTHVLHLHGQLRQCRSSRDPDAIFEIPEGGLTLGALAPDGSQLRPHIVWFGEAVPNLVPAMELAQTADAFAVIGSSLNVYPAASLIQYAPTTAPLFLVDPKIVSAPTQREVHFIQAPASSGVPKLAAILASLA